jgi:hypothetical protein
MVSAQFCLRSRSLTSRRNVQLILIIVTFILIRLFLRAPTFLGDDFRLCGQSVEWLMHAFKWGRGGIAFMQVWGLRCQMYVFLRDRQFENHEASRRLIKATGRVALVRDWLGQWVVNSERGHAGTSVISNVSGMAQRSLNAP